MSLEDEVMIQLRRTETGRALFVSKTDDARLACFRMIQRTGIGTAVAQTAIRYWNKRRAKEHTHTHTHTHTNKQTNNKHKHGSTKMKMKMNMNLKNENENENEDEDEDEDEK